MLATNSGVRGYIQRRREYGQLEAKLKDAQSRLVDKQLNLARAQKDDDFLEQEARRHLGLVRPEEIEFRFVPNADSSSADAEVARTIPPAGGAARKSDKSGSKG
jgi:cell division protein FtsB